MATKRKYRPPIQVHAETYRKLRELADNYPWTELKLRGKMSKGARPGIPLTKMLDLIIDDYYENRESFGWPAGEHWISAEPQEADQAQARQG
jgi:hypothetical protein